MNWQTNLIPALFFITFSLALVSGVIQYRKAKKANRLLPAAKHGNADQRAGRNWRPARCSVSLSLQVQRRPSCCASS